MLGIALRCICLAYYVLITDSPSNPLSIGSAHAHQSHVMMEPLPRAPHPHPGTLHLLASVWTVCSRTAASCPLRSSLAGAVASLSGLGLRSDGAHPEVWFP